MKRALPAFLFLLLLVDARAGQLHVQWFGIAEVARSQGYAVHAKIEKVNAKRSRITVTVLRGWALDEKTAPQGKLKARLYGGVKWTNPRKSPIDRRFVGARHISDLKPGDEILLVPVWGRQWEVASWTEDTPRKLDAFFADGGPAAYRKRATVGQLDADLADFDLYEHAYRELVERKRLTAKALLAAAAHRLPEDPIRKHLGSLKDPGRRAFLTEALAAVKDDPKALDRLVRRSEDHLTEATASAYGPIFAAVEPDTDTARSIAWTLHYWLRKHTSAKAATAFAPFAARYVSQRPDDEQGNEVAEAVATRATGEALERFGLAVLAAAPGKQEDGTVETDLSLLYHAATAAKRRPSRDYVAPLSRITPQTVRILSQKESAVSSILTIAIAVGRKFRDTREPLAAVVEPWLSVRRVDVDEKQRAAWRKLVPKRSTK